MTAVLPFPLWWRPPFLPGHVVPRGGRLVTPAAAPAPTTIHGLGRHPAVAARRRSAATSRAPRQGGGRRRCQSMLSLDGGGLSRPLHGRGSPLSLLLIRRSGSGRTPRDVGTPPPRVLDRRARAHPRWARGVPTRAGRASDRQRRAGTAAALPPPPPPPAASATARSRQRSRHTHPSAVSRGSSGQPGARGNGPAAPPLAVPTSSLLFPTLAPSLPSSNPRTRRPLEPRRRAMVRR